jgi:hypothetical protein
MALGCQQALNEAVKQHLDQFNFVGYNSLAGSAAGAVAFHGFEMNSHVLGLLIN